MGSTALDYTNDFSEKERKTARKSAEAIESLHLDFSSKKKKEDTVEMTIADTEITLPKRALPILQEILNRMAVGKNIHFDEPSEEMTTQEAANFLNVSRPYFIKLLDEKAIAFHKVGNRRKVLTADVTAYKEKLKHSREKGLAKMAALSQEMEGENY
jgi:excisionase family DNA binding protein